jgi:hypothetical protein
LSTGTARTLSHIAPDVKFLRSGGYPLNLPVMISVMDAKGLAMAAAISALSSCNVSHHLLGTTTCSAPFVEGYPGAFIIITQRIGL